MVKDITAFLLDQIMIVKEVHFEYELNRKVVLGKAVYLRRLTYNNQCC